MRAWADLAVMAITFFVAIFWNVEAGVISSMILSLLLIVHRSSQPRLAILVRESLLIDLALGKYLFFYFSGARTGPRRVEAFGGESNLARRVPRYLSCTSEG